MSSVRQTALVIPMVRIIVSVFGLLVFALAVFSVMGQMSRYGEITWRDVIGFVSLPVWGVLMCAWWWAAGPPKARKTARTTQAAEGAKGNAAQLGDDDAGDESSPKTLLPKIQDRSQLLRVTSYALLTFGVLNVLAIDGMSGALLWLVTSSAAAVIVRSRWLWLTLPAVVLCAVVVMRSVDKPWSNILNELVVLVVFGVCVIGLAHLMAALNSARLKSESLAQEVRNLNAQLVIAARHEKEAAVLAERTRHAQDLHDTTGHRLTVIGMSIDLAKELAKSDSDAAWQAVQRARGHVSEALTEIRTSVRALHPLTPGDGLVRWQDLADAFRSTALAVNVETSGVERELSKPISSYIYRLCQEGLTNAHKHGKATAADITVAYGQKALRVTLADNGTAGGEGLPMGFGLRTLRDLAAELGGSFAACRVAGQGCLLTAEIPWDENSVTVDVTDNAQRGILGAPHESSVTGVQSS